MFSCEICEILKNTYFEEHLWTTASYYNPSVPHRILEFFEHIVNHLSANPTNCLNVFDHFLGLALKGLKDLKIAFYLERSVYNIWSIFPKMKIGMKKPINSFINIHESFRRMIGSYSNAN